MDPNACLERIREALRDEDIIEAIDASIDLAAWVNQGGYSPDEFERDRMMGSVEMWGILNFLMGLDPDDEIRHRKEQEARGVVCSECGHDFDDNPGRSICKTCEDWKVTS